MNRVPKEMLLAVLQEVAAVDVEFTKAEAALYIHTELQCIGPAECEGRRAPDVLINEVEILALLFAVGRRICHCRSNMRMILVRL